MNDYLPVIVEVYDGIRGEYKTLKAYVNMNEIVVPAQHGFDLPDEDYDSLDSIHDCDAMGCGWEHVALRIIFKKAEEE